MVYFPRERGRERASELQNYLNLKWQLGRTIGGLHLPTNKRDGLPHFVFLPEESGGGLVKTSDFFTHAGDFALQCHFVSLGSDGAVLQALVASAGAGDLAH